MVRIKINSKISLNIPEPLLIDITQYFQGLYQGVIPNEYQIEKFTMDRLKSSLVQLERLESLGANKKITCLDAGCGIGTFVVVANLAGYNFYGYDLDKKALKVAQELLKANRISPTKIKYNTNFFIQTKKKFDLITSFEVVEHLSDMRNYLLKLSQMIKNQGRLFIETPNYLIPYEPHFYVFLPTLLPKWVGWFFCQRAGRTNRSYFNDLNFVNKYSLEKELKEAGFELENLGLTEWLRSLVGRGMRNRNSLIKRLSVIYQDPKFTGIVRMLARLGAYTPLVYLARQKN